MSKTAKKKAAEGLVEWARQVDLGTLDNAIASYQSTVADLTKSLKLLERVAEDRRVGPAYPQLPFAEPELKMERPAPRSRDR